MARSIISFLCTAAALCALAAGDETSDFDWTSVEPSWDLSYTPCYKDFQCARLLMPLDWLNNETNTDWHTSPSVAIAIITQPATVSPTHPTYGGPVIVNPGGPGDSGVLHILRNGAYLRDLFDTDGERHFDVVSFDPRGMGASTPAADCFAGEAAARAASRWQGRGLASMVGSADEGMVGLKYQRAAAGAYALRCESSEGRVVMEHMATASVARDVLRMVDEMDRLHRQNRLDANRGHDAQQKQLSLSESPDVAAPRLQYYGTSYGTILGNTIMSMYPGRVKRMVLDGVIIPEDWAKGNRLRSYKDTSNTIDYFYKTCFAVNSTCPLRTHSDTSWHDIKRRVEDLIQDLDTNPVPVVVPHGPDNFLTGNDVRSVVFDPALYDPLDYFPALADTLAESLQGNHTRLIQALGLSANLDAVCHSTKADYSWMDSAMLAVVCSDAADTSDRSLEYWASYNEQLKAACPEMGDTLLSMELICSEWKLRAKFRFDGPFTSPAAVNTTNDDNQDNEDRPLAPILFLSSLYDPVTPLASAHEASKGHPGSRVLVQNSVGHCTLLSSPSECTKKTVRAYMSSGFMPAEGVVCEGDCVPWEECPFLRGKLPR